MRIKAGILIFIAIVTACSPGIKNLHSRGTNIVCFGNSITSGVGAEPPYAYPAILDSLTERKVINAGSSGDTTAFALWRLEKDILAKNPFLVIIELGGNDFLLRVPERETVNNLEKMIIRIQDEGSAVALCDISSGFGMSAYKNDFKRLAKRRGAIFIPNLLDGILDNPSLRSDYIHPNKEGYALIARRIYKEISKYFDL